MDVFIGTILAFGFNYPPVGWLQCNGQILTITQYQALYALLGKMYGGDGKTTFALPDLRGRGIIGVGQGKGFNLVPQGSFGGVEIITLQTANMPAHTHPLTGLSASTKITSINSEAESNETSSGENYLGTGGNMAAIYRESETSTDFLGGVSTTVTGTPAITGSGLPFNSRNPYLGLNYCIATEGIFPQRQ